MNEEELKRFMETLRADLRSDVRSGMNEGLKTLVDERIELRMKPIEDAIGHVNDAKTGGTGLAGELARQGAKIDQLVGLRNMGAGVALCLSVTGALLFLGFKELITGLSGK